ncbi:hypothetical protein Q8A67_019489 [Cirrhinus molitorella]|uniref:Uncharacterized protein n=1 Tax=Cirrhinus molitorella TaxID=172907 RepID=A0AA88TPT0_9TELE|nr:hypothetical protein Q8A67_019489 [Cirrhinus molitorella]
MVHINLTCTTVFVPWERPISPRACWANLVVLFLTLGILVHIVHTVRKGAGTVPEPHHIQPLITNLPTEARLGQSPCSCTAHRGDSPQVQDQEVTECVASDHQLMPLPNKQRATGI